DRRVYTSWTASPRIAYLEAAARLDRSDLGDAARKLLESLFERSYRAGGGLEHGEGVQGQLGDQVWGLLAAVRAYSAGLGTRWLDNARELAEHLETLYADARFGGYFDRAEGGDLGRLGERLKPLAENAVAALALFELDVLIGEPDAPYRSRGERALTSVAQLPPRLGIMAASFQQASPEATVELRNRRNRAFEIYDFKAGQTDLKARRRANLDQLEGLVDSFRQSLEAAGGIFHYAADAQAAREVIGEICRG